MPSFVDVDTSTNTFTIENYDLTHKGGIYTVLIKVEINSGEFIEKQMKITVHSYNSGPPYFSPPLANRKVTVGKSLKIDLSEIIDPDNDSLDIVIVLGMNRPFMSGDFPNYIVKPRASDVGVYTVFVSLKD